ncbi:hypothetical protein BsWGS_09572 [Bradybaena similaris]
MATLALFQNTSGIRLCTVEQKEDEYKEFYETAQTVTGLVIYPLACIPGFLGNMLTIFVLSRRNMLTSTNAFLSALAVSDSIKLVNDIMYILVTVFLRTNEELGKTAYSYLYPYAHFIFSMSVCVSSWLTVSVAIERYILVCHPTRARAFWNRKRAVWLCVCIYVIMTLLALPSALRYRTVRCIDRKTGMPRLEVELTEIWQNQLLTKAYEWIQNLLRSIIPLLVLVVLNVCIICALKRSKANRGRNPRHRVTIMMIIVILVFLICITPDAILSTVFEFGYHEEGYLEKGIREITDSLLTINAAVNFIIYCVFNQVFRKSFARICCPTDRPVGWITELDESTYRRLSEAKYLLSTNNNSPPRRNTPPKLKPRRSLQENHIVLNSGVVSNTTGRKPSVERSCSLNTDSYQDISRQNSPLMTSSSSSSSEHGNSRAPQSNQQNLQHQHRGSSGGLKKSRNSVKSNRAKNIAKVTFLENDELLEELTGEVGEPPFQADSVGVHPNSKARVQQARHHAPITDLPDNESDFEVLTCNDSGCRIKTHTERKKDSITGDNVELFNFSLCDGSRIVTKVRFKEYINGSADTFRHTPIVEKDRHDATDSRARQLRGNSLIKTHPDSKSDNLASHIVKSQDSKSDSQSLPDTYHPDARTIVAIKGDNNIPNVHSPDSVVYDDIDCFPSSHFCDQILTTDV